MGEIPRPATVGEDIILPRGTNSLAACTPANPYHVQHGSIAVNTRKPLEKREDTILPYMSRVFLFHIAI